jgi:Flp pilus assembly protein TadD
MEESRQTMQPTYRRNLVDRGGAGVIRSVTMPHPRIEPLKKVLAIDPNDDVAWFGLGKAHMEDRSWEEAIAAFRRCVNVKPTYSAAYYALAQCLQQVGRTDECRHICDQGIDVSRKNGDAMVTKNLEALKQTLG